MYTKLYRIQYSDHHFYLQTNSTICVSISRFYYVNHITSETTNETVLKTVRNLWPHNKAGDCNFVLNITTSNTHSENCLIKLILIHHGKDQEVQCLLLGITQFTKTAM